MEYSLQEISRRKITELNIPTTLEETDMNIGVKNNFCSIYFESKSLLFRGECKKNKFKKRSALITAHDLETGEIFGISSEGLNTLRTCHVQQLL